MIVADVVVNLYPKWTEKSLTCIFAMMNWPFYSGFVKTPLSWFSQVMRLFFEVVLDEVMRRVIFTLSFLWGPLLRFLVLWMCVRERGLKYLLIFLTTDQTEGHFTRNSWFLTNHLQPVRSRWATVQIQSLLFSWAVLELFGWFMFTHLFLSHLSWSFSCCLWLVETLFWCAESSWGSSK